MHVRTQSLEFIKVVNEIKIKMKFSLMSPEIIRFKYDLA